MIFDLNKFLKSLNSILGLIFNLFLPHFQSVTKSDKSVFIILHRWPPYGGTSKGLDLKMSPRIEFAELENL